MTDKPASNPPANPAANAAAYDASMERIRTRFVEKLKTNLPTFVHAAHMAAEGAALEGDVPELRRAIHSLAGSAKIFGFPKLTLYAAEVERHLDAYLEGMPLNAMRDTLGLNFSRFLTEVESIVASGGQGAVTSSASSAKPSSSIAGAGGTKAEVFIQPAIGTRTYRVLVVDDDELMRTLLAEVLAPLGCEVIKAADGAEALVFLDNAQRQEATAPDAVVLDWNMPGINGLEVLRAIKTTHGLAEVPVILLTKRDEDALVVEGIASGAVDFLTKPFDVHELAARVLEVVQRHKTRVLVADDDELVCDLLQQRFTRLGYTVSQVANGWDVLESMEQHKPDIVVLDIMMPGMDGMTVLKHIRERPALSDIPVVMLTAKGQRDNVLKGLENGAHDYITKPFDVDEVAARVFGILHRHMWA